MKAVLFAALAAALAACGGENPASPTPPPDGAVTTDGEAVQVDAALENDAPVDASPPDVAPRPAVFISEVMYHPVLEDDYEDQHEFVELHNRGTTAVDLAGWRLAGDASYTFPDGASLPAQGYVVIAKNRAALAAIPSYGLTADSLFGDYRGQLSNGKGLVSVLDAQAVVVDALKYADKFPWPIAADALGTGESSLPAAFLPLANHRHRGISLERVNFDLPAGAISNWVPSPLDGASPGRANSVTGLPPAVVEMLTTTAPSGELIRSADEAVIRIGLSPQGGYEDVQLEYFVDDLERTDETHTIVSVPLTGIAGEVRVPPQPDASIVRYRILATKPGGSAQVLSPRPSDPYAWHAYFVSPPITSARPPYQLFLKSTDWGRLWTNIDFPDIADRRVVPEMVGDKLVRCKIRESWDARVPAVFVYQGEVFDVRVRYQGSRFNRLSGRQIDLARTSFHPPPSPMMVTGDPPVPSLEALSWNVNFPRYHRFPDGRDSLILNKLNQSCPGLDAGVGELLYEAAGLPASKAEYRRFYVNGGYYAYVMDIENPSEQMLERYTPAGTRLGDLFKASGNDGYADEGPWGPADERLLPPICSPAYDSLTRYAYTYERKTWDWKDASDIKNLIEGLDAARTAAHLDDADTSNDDLPTLRKFLDQTFAIDKTLTYLAVRNWAEPWDDWFHNHFLYKDASGRWSYVPWDLDREFGEEFGWNAHRSFFIGQKDDPDSRRGFWNRLKDALVRSYRGELLAKLDQLTSEPDAADPKRGVLSAKRWRAMVEEAAARFDASESAASPVKNPCDFQREKNNLLQFADTRNLVLADVQWCASHACGLTAEYFKGPSFEPADRVFTRTDRAVGFRWSSPGPAPDFPSDVWQVRWTGRLTPPGPGLYTFHVSVDGGARLWVSGFPVIDDWVAAPLREDSVTVPLFLATSFDIRLEYVGGGSGAGVTLSWSGPGVPAKQFLGGRYLTPP